MGSAKSSTTSTRTFERSRWPSSGSRASRSRSSPRKRRSQTPRSCHSSGRAPDGVSRPEVAHADENGDDHPVTSGQTGAASSQRHPTSLGGGGVGGKPVPPALWDKLELRRHWGGRIHSGRLSCFFPATPNVTLRKGAGGEHCFPRPPGRLHQQ